MRYSYIIPVYNCKSYIEDCVNSILSVELSDLEILLVDDGSTDGSGAVCDALAERHSQVRVIHQPNGGVSAARNRGLTEAKGEYILFVDADDVVAPIHPELLQLLEKEKPDMMIFGMCFEYHKHHRLVRREEMTAAGQFGQLSRFADRITELFDANYFSPVWNKIMKRQVIIQQGIQFDPRLTNYEDLAFSVHILSKCDTVAVDPYVGYYYQIQEGQDHTVQRIARIEDVMGNTDLIAQAFLELEKAMDQPEATAQIRRIIFRIYKELFWVKMQTARYGTIGRYCADFRKNTIIQSCLPYITETKLENDLIYRWICGDQVWKIWCYVRYRKVRHRIARVVKKALRWER